MSRGPRPKIVRLIETYDLQNLGDELERRWSDPDDGSSLRQLTRYVNVRVLRSALDGVDQTFLDGEVENLYRLLTDDDVSPGDRAEARNRLARYDIDPDRLTSDFVSRQAVHNYLTNHRNVSSPGNEALESDPRTDRLQSIRRLESRLETIARSNVSDLRADGDLSLGDFEVFVTVRVHCNECDAQLTVENLVAGRDCDCTSAT